MPAISLRSEIERSARTVPIAVVVRRCSRWTATATATDSIGSGWTAPAAADAASDERFHTARPAAIASTVSTRTKDPIHPAGRSAPRRGRRAWRLACLDVPSNGPVQLALFSVTIPQGSPAGEWRPAEPCPDCPRRSVENRSRATAVSSEELE